MSIPKKKGGDIKQVVGLDNLNRIVDNAFLEEAYKKSIKVINRGGFTSLYKGQKWLLLIDY